MDRSRLWALIAGISLTFACALPAIAADASDCPNDGTVRFGIEPYDSAARPTPIYDKLGKLIGDKLSCKVEVLVATSYNAEIEAMRNDKLDIGESRLCTGAPGGESRGRGRLWHRRWRARYVWASLVTYPDSGIETVAEIKGHSFAFSDRPRPQVICTRPTVCGRTGSTPTRT